MTMARVLFCVGLLSLGPTARADERGVAPRAPGVSAAVTSSPAAPTTQPGAPPTGPSAAALAPPVRGPLERIPNGSDSPHERFWLTADYLLWAVQSSGAPALVVRDPLGTPRAAVGVPTTPGQQVLVGGTGRNGDLRSGLRLTGGVRLGCDGKWAVGWDFFFLGASQDRDAFGSPGNVPLSRPFFNIRAGRPDAELVAFPGVLAGSATVDSRNTFTGSGAYARYPLCASDPCDPCGTGYRFDFLTGYRHLELNDTLQVREDLLTIGANGAIAPGTRIVVTDRFRTENTFDGGFLALTGAAFRGRWSGEFTCGVSLGTLHRALDVTGTTFVSGSGLRAGGLLGQPSNIGRYTSDTFTAVPEIGLNVGYQLAPGLSLRVGYTLFYLPNTWRVGDQIDLGVDPNQLAGVPSSFGRPAARRASTGSTVQGLNLGLLLRY